MTTTPSSARLCNAYAGIDGGGSQTSVAIVTADGQLLSTGHAGPSNTSAVGIERAFGAILTALQEAASRLPPAVSIVHVHAALAGVGSTEQQLLLRPHLVATINTLNAAQPTRWRSPSCSLSHDAAAVLAANRLTEGIVLIAGTGSFVWGQDDTGRSVRCGGWGYLLGDPASGFDLGRRAFCAVLAFADGYGSPTALTQRLLSTFHCHYPYALIPALYSSDDPRATLAALAPLVLDTALAGDAAARALVHAAATDLAHQVTVVYHQLQLAQPTLLLSGAVARHPAMAAALHLCLDTHLTSCTWQYPQRSPAEGAAFLALHRAVARTSS